jgi:8-oxo-dGTP diphosphatase
MTRSFPNTQWAGLQVCFNPEQDSAALPTDMPHYASLVFPFSEGSLLLADIPGRGWTIPGGRLEAGETALVAAEREAQEETGAQLEHTALIGWYRLESLEPSSLNSPVRCVPVYVGHVCSVAPIPQGSESRGVRLVSLQDLPEVYYTWDALIEAVCTYAFDFADNSLS